MAALSCRLRGESESGQGRDLSIRSVDSMTMPGLSRWLKRINKNVTARLSSHQKIGRDNEY
jgi:hypothetical protein